MASSSSSSSRPSLAALFTVVVAVLASHAHSQGLFSRQQQNPFFSRQQSFVQQQQQLPLQQQQQLPLQQQQNPFFSRQQSLVQQQQQLPLQQRQGGGGFSCPERNGYFANPRQCDAYYKCENGAAKEELCPEGLLFNDKNSPFAYPCSYPQEVQCLGRSSLQPAQPTEDCPHQYGYFALGDAAHCGRFMNCAAGRGYVLDCPDGLAFNPRTLHCDWPDQVAECDAEAFLQFRCPEEPRLFGALPPAGVRFHRSPADCGQYFACVAGRPRRHHCEDGQAFSEELGRCDDARNVPGC